MNKNQFELCLYPYDMFAPPISFRKFIEVWGKNRKSSGITPENVYPKPKEKGWFEKFGDEYLKDNDNERL